MTRIVTSSAARLVAGIAAALALPATAMAWSVALDAPTQRDAVLTYASGNANGQFWAYDVGNVGWTNLLRYDGNTRTASVMLREPGFTLLPLVTADGSLLAVLHDGTHSGRCRIVKFAADGTRRWEQSFDEPCGFGLPGDVRAWQLGDAGYWVKTDNRFSRLAPDGRVLHTLGAGEPGGSIEAVDPNNGNFYVSTPVVDKKSAVIAYSRDGKELWRNEVGVNVRISVAADGSLRVIGATPNLFLARIDGNGRTQWTTDLGITMPTQDAAALLAPVLDGGATTVALHGADAAIRVDAAGRVSWRVSSGALGVNTAGPLKQARLAPNGDMVFVYGTQLARVDASGAVRFSRDLAAGQSATAATLQTFGTDASAVVLLSGQSGIGNGLLRVSVTGGDLASPVTRSVVTQSATASRVPLSDGSIVAWTNAASGERELQRVDGDGRVTWRQATPGTWTRPSEAEPAGGALVAAGDRVCALDGVKRDALVDHVLTCYRTSDGSQIWTRRLHEGGTDNGYTLAQLHAAADGSISAWYGASTGTTAAVEFARVDRDGNLIGTKHLSSGSLADLSTVNAPFAVAQAGADVTVYGADGSERFHYTQSAAQTVYGAFAADGSWVAVSWDALASKSMVERYSASGQRSWSRTFDGNLRPTAPVVIGDAVYVATCCSTGDVQQRAVVRLKLADGTTAWQRELPVLSGYVFDTAQLAATPQGDALMAVSSSARTLDIDVIETQDGAVRTRRREACRSQNCIAGQPLVAGDRLHLLDAGPTASSFVGWKIQPARNGLVRLDQVGLAGAWWAPYANGEGFVLDFLPPSRTFFMPWFTFSRQGGNDPAGQRWYVVQGSVAPNATKAELPITRAVGGVFDAGPPVPGEIVGKAVVSFTDCSNGTLEYAFDAGVNGAASGVITLTRLSPATTACTLADGTTQPGAGTRPAANGFDSRMSGSWFEEATSGQGLQFVIQPNGLYFAPWFTFDPAGPSDDPDRQRWFTLQGSLENARNGVVEAPIVQGIGGAFDRIATGNVSLVGKSKLTFAGCDRAKLEYTFDDNEVAGPMRGLAGAIDLVKIGGCQAQ